MFIIYISCNPVLLFQVLLIYLYQYLNCFSSGRSLSCRTFPLNENYSNDGKDGTFFLFTF